MLDATQVDAAASSLASGGTFILEAPDEVYLWFGKGSKNEEREFARKSYKTLHALAKVHSGFAPPEVQQEFVEAPEFWKALGVADWETATAEDTRPAYGTSTQEDGRTPDAEHRNPRLFHCAKGAGTAAQGKAEPGQRCKNVAFVYVHFRVQPVPELHVEMILRPQRNLS